MPAEATVRGWVIDGVGTEFAAHYARARELQARGWEEQILEIADTPQSGVKTVVKSAGTETIEGDMIEHRRLQVDPRKWRLSKVLPKVYGDKVSAEIKAEISQDEGAPVTPLQLAREIAFALHLGVREAQAAAERGDASSTSDQSN